MSTTKTWNGQTYIIPGQGDTGAWGTLYQQFLVALADNAVSTSQLSSSSYQTLNLTDFVAVVSAIGSGTIRFHSGQLQVSINGSRYQTIIGGNTVRGIYNVMDFGAKGDGVTDDTAAIQACIEAALVANGKGGGSVNARGALIYLPANQYIITRSLIISQGLGITFFGDGQVSTQIRWGGTNGLARWASATAYTVGQVVNFHGQSYSCITAGTTIFGPNYAGISSTSLDGATFSSSWATSTVYTINTQVLNGTNVYKCTTGGTSASSGGGPTGTSSSIADGSTVVWAYVGARPVQWICNGQDTNSDMLICMNYSQLVIRDMEFISAILTAVNSPTTKPNFCIRSYTNSNTLQPSGLIIKDFLIDWSGNNTGLPNQHDVGIGWDTPNLNGSGNNNSEGFLFDVGMNGASTAGVYINGAEAQDHEFYRLQIQNSNAVGIMTGNGGSFSVRDSNVNCTPGTGTVYVIGAPNDRILIDHCITEDAGRMLSVGLVAANASANFGGSIWPVTIRNCRWSANSMALDSRFIIYTDRGPFVFEGNAIDGGTATPIGAPTIYLGSSGNPFRARITDNGFTYHSPGTGTPYTATDASIVGVGGPGVVERGNEYVNQLISSPDSFTRLEAGTINFYAPATWTQSTFYGYITPNAGHPSTVAVNSALYQNFHFSGGGGTSASTGSGPSGQEVHNSGITDGTCFWVMINDPIVGSPAIDGSAYYHRFEIPMFSTTAYTITPIITSRTGSSTASLTITSVVKYLHGFTINLSGAPTGTDTITMDWTLSQA